MIGVSDAVLVAIIMTVPTLMVYFGSRKKQQAETDSVISENWKKLTAAQNTFSQQMEDRLKEMNDKVMSQDGVIATQNATIASQNSTIAAQSARISEQDKLIQEQKETIADLTKQIEGMGGTPVQKRGKGNAKNNTFSSPGIGVLFELVSSNSQYE